jgi:polyhydroxyalkanoate synthase subunit PhaC
MDTHSRIVPTDNEALSQAPLALHAVDAFRALDQTKDTAIARLIAAGTARRFAKR